MRYQKLSAYWIQWVSFSESIRLGKDRLGFNHRRLQNCARFFLFCILPGDPARSVKDPRLTVEAMEALRVCFGLDSHWVHNLCSIAVLAWLQTQEEWIVEQLQGACGRELSSGVPVAPKLFRFTVAFVEFLRQKYVDKRLLITQRPLKLAKESKK